MRRYAILVVLAALFCGVSFAQMFPGPGVKSYAPTGVTISSHGRYVDGGAATCSGTAPATCTVSSVAITTGDAVAVFWQYCDNASCVTPEIPSSIAVSDGTNTYTLAVNGAAGAAVRSYAFVAKNVSGGTKTFSLTRTAPSGNAVFYSAIYIIDLAGASLTAPVDTSGAANGNSTSPSVTTSGNVTNANSVGLCALDAANGATVYTAPYTVLDFSVGDGRTDASTSNPTTGTTSTCAATTLSGLWATLIVVITP